MPISAVVALQEHDSQAGRFRSWYRVSYRVLANGGFFFDNQSRRNCGRFIPALTFSSGEIARSEVSSISFEVEGRSCKTNDSVDY
jgi:hypothetical protein